MATPRLPNVLLERCMAPKERIGVNKALSLAGLNDMTQLRVAEDDGATRAWVLRAANAASPAGPPFPRLRKLWLKGPFMEDATSLLAVLPVASITHLHLDAIDAPKRFLDLGWTALRRLHLHGLQLRCPLVMRATQLPALQHLDCSGTRITDLVVVAHPALGSVKCTDCPALETLCLVRCPALRHLDFRHANKLTDIDLRMCGRLHDVTFSDDVGQQVLCYLRDNGFIRRRV